MDEGQNWPYVWTRDTAYSALLSLAAIDPKRTVNSLLFKTSHLKPEVIRQLPNDHGNGMISDVQIVQDTG